MLYDLTNKAKFTRNFSLKGQIQDAYNHAGRTFALIGDIERARCRQKLLPAADGEVGDLVNYYDFS